jgi:hypothetical protein
MPYPNLFLYIDLSLSYSVCNLTFVLELKSGVITLQKEGRKGGIACDKDIKVTGDLREGSKIHNMRFGGE